MQTQTQDTSNDSLLKLWEWYDANKKFVILALVIAALVVAWFSWSSSQREQNEITAGENLTKILFAPGASGSQTAGPLQQLAANYPGTAAAQRAQLQAASVLFNAGQYTEAQTQFQKFLDVNSGSGDTLAASAQLGVAVCLESLGKPEALAAYQKVVNGYSGTSSAEIAKQSVLRLTPKTPIAIPATPAKS